MLSVANAADLAIKRIERVHKWLNNDLNIQLNGSRKRMSDIGEENIDPRLVDEINNFHLIFDEIKAIVRMLVFESIDDKNTANYWIQHYRLRSATNIASRNYQRRKRGINDAPERQRNQRNPQLQHLIDTDPHNIKQRLRDSGLFDENGNIRPRPIPINPREMTYPQLVKHAISRGADPCDLSHEQLIQVIENMNLAKQAPPDIDLI